MKKVFSLIGISFFFLLALSPLAFKELDSEKLTTAIDRNLLRIQKKTDSISGNAANAQIQQQALPDMEPAMDLANLVLAREKGFSVQDENIKTLSDQVISNWTVYQSHFQKIPDSSFSVRNEMLVLKSVQNQLPVSLQQKMKEWIVKTPLLNAVPVSNASRVSGLLTMAGSNPDTVMVKRLVKKLRDSQLPDGGWSSENKLPSDVYSTGQILCAFGISGILATTDSIYQKGLLFLLDTQQADRSWEEEESNWATMAMLLAAK